MHVKNGIKINTVQLTQMLKGTHLNINNVFLIALLHWKHLVHSKKLKVVNYYM